MSEKIPNVTIEQTPRPLLQRLSIVWVIPLLALAVSAFLAWQSYQDRGPLVEISFEDASGISANTTELRYRDIKVGIVEEVALSSDLDTVTVSIRLDQSIASYVDQEAQFWIVRPELTTRGVTGLDTVLSGVFIEGSWDTDAGTPATSFQGLSTEPLYRADQPGLQIGLRSVGDGQFTENSPILFRGIEVGRIGAAYIDPQSKSAVAEAIIYAPHDRMITSSTRFWDTSGFSFSIGAGGAAIDFSSVASLLAGGITFDTFVSGGTPVTAGQEFEVFVDESSARQSMFNASDVEDLLVSVVFENNVSGLAVDAPVYLQGLRVGSVQSVVGLIDDALFGDNRVRLNAVLAIRPTLLGLQEDASAENALAFLQTRASEGLRARLASESLLTGGLRIEFVQFDDAPPVAIQTTASGMSILPTTASEIADAGSTVEATLTRLNDLPIEELLTSATDFLRSAQGLLASDDLREAPGELRGLLGEMRGLVGSEDTQAILTGLAQLVGRMESLVSDLETEQTVSKLVTAIETAAQAARDVGSSVEGVPGLIDQLTGVASNASNVPLDALASELASVLEAAHAILSVQAAQDLPATLNTALSELEQTLRDLREGGAVENVNQTLASARDAADSVALSAKDLPALAERMTQLLAQASRTIEGYNRGEEVSRDAQSAMRDIQEAAEAITSLARTLERNPSALIRGR